MLFVEQKPARIKTNGIRASKRIHLKVMFLIVGEDEAGCDFEEQAETLVVSPAGGCFTFFRDVKEGDNLRLIHSCGRSFIANVRSFRFDPISRLRYVGFKLSEPKIGWVVADGNDSLGKLIN
jgi:hypothetical protein